MPALRALLAALAAALLTVLTLQPAIGAAPGPGAAPTDSAQVVDDIRRQLDLPGIAVRVTGPQGSWTKAVGQDGDGRPFGADTGVLVGSVSKSFTATTVLRLVEQKRLRLDDEVASRLPWFEHRGITVRDLLRHTSGYDEGAGLEVAARFDTAPGALRRAAQDAASETPSGKRGTYSYSDANYLLLGALVEQVIGRPYGEVLRSEVLAPMRLTRTGASDATPRTVGHRSWFGTWRDFDGGYDDSGAPYGYVVSTLADLDRYAAAHRSGRGLPLSDADRRAMQTAQSDAGKDDQGKPMWYGFGWRGGQLGGQQVVEHTGATPGFFTHVVWLPERGVRVTMVTNAYAQGQDERLASVARDLALLAAGERPTSSASSDPVLQWAPYVLVALTVLGLAAGVVAVRSRRRRWWLLVPAVLLAAVAWLTPSLLLGLSGRTVRLWAPDLGWSLIAVSLVWTVVALLALVVPVLRKPVSRHRSAPYAGSNDHATSPGGNHGAE